MENSLQVKDMGYQLEQAGSMLGLATTLADFIKERKLSQNIQGREYVLVEGWQFCGGMLGVLPVITETQDHSKPEEIIYTAKCDLINIKTSAKVGGAESMCSNKEKGKKHFEAYAIQSMAQTRCIGKAYRLMIGWLMKAAGYEATPAEEMDTLKEQENEIRAAAIEYLQSESREEAAKVWNKYPQHRNNPVFLKAAKALSALYPKQEGKPVMASDKQKELIRGLLNSHHVPASYREHVADIEAASEGLTLEDAKLIIDDLQGMIAKGGEYEKTTPATPEHIKQIEQLLDDDVISPDEEEKGKAKMAKGYSIAQANAAIKKLQEIIQERNKVEANV